uniref:hypothetical protein n=1 Tax=Algoriphagus locisalis TaxID=305507 RepID=UPI0011139D98|nr:hypothetical protein [Algoriphagus locisalis]
MKDGRLRTVLSPLVLIYNKDEEVLKNSLKKLIVDIDPESKEVKHYEVEFPDGYVDKYLTDMLSYPPNLLHLDSDGLDYYTFPYSDSVFIYRDSTLVAKSVFKTFRQLKFSGSEFVTKTFPGTGQMYATYDLKKESAATLELLIDKEKKFFLLIRKLNETGNGENTYRRTKNYLFSCYSLDFEPLGELEFSYKPGVDLENYFLTSEGLFINKPEQASEDEYEFYKIDLSGFGD